MMEVLFASKVLGGLMVRQALHERDFVFTRRDEWLVTIPSSTLYQPRRIATRQTLGLKMASEAKRTCILTGLNLRLLGAERARLQASAVVSWPSVAGLRP